MAGTRDSLSPVVSLLDRPKSSSDIDRLLDRNETTIRNLPAGEANKHYRLQTLAAMEAELASVVAGHGAPLRALVMHAELAAQLRNWPEAARRWQRVAEQSAEHRALAHLRSATAFRRMGNLHAAEIAFRSAEGMRKSKAYVREKSALASAINGWMSAKLMHNALDQMKVRRQDNAIALFRTAMFLKGADDPTLQFADSVFRELMQLGEKGATASASSEPDDRPTSLSGSPPIVLISGLGWSGSGAVTDYLQEFAPVSLPFGTTELAGFDAECSAYSILKAAQERRGTLKEELVDFFMVSVLGVGKESHDAKTIGKVRNQALIKHFRGSPHELEGLKTACIVAFEAINKARHSTDALERITRDLRNLFGDIFRLKANDSASDLLLLNNAIHARNIHLIELLPNSTGLVVDRDPRDKYVDRLTMGSVKDVDSFISRTKLQLAGIGKALEKRNLARCIEVVRFEDFVSSVEVRRAVLDRLGLSDADRNGKQRFFPEQSQQNIGIYRAHPNQKDIERIHEELSPHLIEPTL